MLLAARSPISRRSRYFDEALEVRSRAKSTQKTFSKHSDFLYFEIFICFCIINKGVFVFSHPNTGGIRCADSLFSIEELLSIFHNLFPTSISCNSFGDVLGDALAKSRVGAELSRCISFVFFSEEIWKSVEWFLSVFVSLQGIYKTIKIIHS